MSGAGRGGADPADELLTELTVIRGKPTDEELAAVVVVLMTCAQLGAAPPVTHADRGTIPVWTKGFQPAGAWSTGARRWAN